MNKYLLALIVINLMSSICWGQNERVKGSLERQYHYVSYDSDWNLYIVGDDSEKRGIYDADGEMIIRPRYTSIWYDKEDNMYHVQIGDKVGYCDGKGKEIISPNKYTSIWYNKEADMYSVQVGDKVGYCDGKGKEIISPNKYTSIWYNKEADMYQVKIGDKVGYCDGKGKEIISPNKYTSILYIKVDNMYKVKIGDKVGYCDGKGKEIISPNKYTEVFYDKEDNRYLVQIGDKVGYCDGKGKEIITPQYKQVYPRRDSNDVYYIVEEIKFGICNSLGGLIVKPMYDSIYSASEGLCPVKLQNRWGFISVKDGAMVIPIEYEKVSLFQDGVAKVTKNGKTMLLANPMKAVARKTTRPQVIGRAISVFPIADSEVDKNIPMGKKADENTHAFIIANENYPVAKVPYALNDGWVFEQYCKKTLGIKEVNVHIFEDATGGNILACVEQMKQVAKAAKGAATIIFYYAGHAFPDEKKNTAYLLPIDGDSKNPATGYSLERLYKELNSVPTKQVVCFLDACFSGATRDDQMLIAGRGVAIKVKDEIPQGNMVVVTSATGAETAHSYEEMHHGLFTYYLLEKLQQTKGDVTLGDLAEYVTKMVKRKSVLINQKKQTPTVIPSPQQQTSWQDIRL